MKFNPLLYLAFVVLNSQSLYSSWYIHGKKSPAYEKSSSFGPQSFTTTRSNPKNSKEFKIIGAKHPSHGSWKYHRSSKIFQKNNHIKHQASKKELPLERTSPLSPIANIDLAIKQSAEIALPKFVALSKRPMISPDYLAFIFESEVMDLNSTILANCERILVSLRKNEANERKEKRKYISFETIKLKLHLVKRAAVLLKTHIQNLKALVIPSYIVFDKNFFDATLEEFNTYVENYNNKLQSKQRRFRQGSKTRNRKAKSFKQAAAKKRTWAVDESIGQTVEKTVLPKNFEEEADLYIKKDLAEQEKELERNEEEWLKLLSKLKQKRDDASAESLEQDEILYALEVQEETWAYEDWQREQERQYVAKLEKEQRKKEKAQGLKALKKEALEEKKHHLSKSKKKQISSSL